MKRQICKHCRCEVEWLETDHAYDGEWCASNENGFNICEANEAGHFEHEPELREYTEAELEEINRKAREVANWGAAARARAERRAQAFQWAKLVAALGFVAMAGYFVGAARCLG